MIPFYKFELKFCVSKLDDDDDDDDDDGYNFCLKTNKCF